MKTLQLKLRPGSADWLNNAAAEVNQVWNYCNEVSAKAARPFYGKPKFLSAFTLHKLLAGSCNFFDHLPAHTIARIGTEYATRRLQFKVRKLRWRISQGSRRSLGWVPFRDKQVRWKNGALAFAGHRFRVFDSYGLDKYKPEDFRSGSFSQNALGEWFVNIAVREPEPPKALFGIVLDFTLSSPDSSPDRRLRWAIMPTDKLNDPRWACNWWVTYPNGTRKLSNFALTRAQAEKRENWTGPDA